MVSTLALLLVLANILPIAEKKSSAANSFQAGYNSGSTNADFSIGSNVASTDTALPSLATGYNNTNSLSYSYDGTSTLKYPTASNLPADKGSIEMKFQKSAYGNATDQDKGSMNRPGGIAYDATTGNIYVADSQNHRIIRTKIDGSGWSTFGSYGTGTGQFNVPTGIRFFGGYLYIADTNNNRVIKTRFDGGDWQAKSGFSAPRDLEYDDSLGDVYVANTGAGNVIKVRFGTLNWETASIGGPVGIHYEQETGFLYIALAENLLRKVKFDGTGTVNLNMPWRAYGWGGSILSYGLYSDPVTGYVYSTYHQNGGGGSIAKLKMDGSEFIENVGFDCSAASAYDPASQMFYIAHANQYSNYTDSYISKSQIDKTGWTTFGSYGNNLMKFSGRTSYDPASGYVYIADGPRNRIIKTKIDGTGWQTYGTIGGGIGQFYRPSGISYDSVNEDIYVVDSGNSRVVKTKIDGSGWSALNGQGQIQGVFYDSSEGYLYLNNNNDLSIRKVKMDGSNLTTLSGFGNNSRSGSAIFYDSASQYIYVADMDANSIVRTKIDGSGWLRLGLMKGLTIDLGQSYSINRALIQAAYQNYYSIDYSSDNVTWQQLYAVPLASASGLKQRDSGTLPTVNARYIRFYQTRNVDWNGSVSEIQIFDTGGANVAAGKTVTANYSPAFGSASLITDGVLAPEATSWNNATYATYLLPQGYPAANTGNGVAQFNYPHSIWYDSASDFIYVADTYNNRIVKTKIDGTGWSTYGSSGSGVGNFNSPQSIQFDSASGYFNIGDTGNSRFVRTKIDGTGWQTTSDFNSKEKILYSAQATDDSRMVYDVASRKLRFYLAYSNKAQFVETPTLSLTDGSWYTVKASFNKAAHTLSIDLNGVNQVTQTYDTDWGSLSYGTSFYIGARNGSTTDRWDGMIDDINVNIESVDTTLPTNPTTANAHLYSDNTKATAFTSDNWGNTATPYITWSGASDADSGIKGYYLYFGTATDAEPNTTSGLLTPNNGVRLFQTHVGVASAEQYVSVPANVLVSGTTYNLIMRTQDNDLNSADKVTLFTYKYDGGAPNPPEFVNVSPAGCSTAPTFTFTWPKSADEVSGLVGYEYKKGTQGTVITVPNLNLADESYNFETTPYQEGDNILYLRAKDNAGNFSAWQTGIFCSTGNSYIVDGPTVTTGPSSMAVTWASSKKTTGFIEVKDGDSYREPQGHRDYKTTHTVTVGGLKSEKAYQYRVIWQDEDKNDGETEWFATQTATTPQIVNLKSEVISPTRAIISFSTNYDASTVLEYGVGSFTEKVESDGTSSSITKDIPNLTANSTYNVRVTATTKDGADFTSGITFATPPTPTISGIKFDPITDQSSAGMKVTWSTNVETTSTIMYGPKGDAKKEISHAEKVKEHEISISNLSDDTQYEVYASGLDQYGNSATSDTNNFKTALDSRPPKITDLAIDSTSVGSGTDAKAQIAVSFKTDEPATAQIEYGEGSSSDSYSSKTQEDATLSKDHVIIISNLDPSKIYHLRAKTSDKSKNVTNSEDNAVITKKPTESAFNLILQSLSKAFSWLKIFNKNDI